MTPTELGFMIRGMCATPGMTEDAIGARAISAALEASGEKAPAPQGYKRLNVPLFCFHNVSIFEPCAACPIAGERIFGFSIPPKLRYIYLSLEDLNHVDRNFADGSRNARHAGVAPDDPAHDAAADAGSPGFPGSAFAGGGPALEHFGPGDVPRLRVVPDERGDGRDDPRELDVT
jgi:hypothetical protein